MAFIDAGLGGPFSSAQLLSGGVSDQLSTNVFDAVTAKKLFAGNGGVKISVVCTAAGGTTPNLRARFVGADNAALSSNPIILADSGASRTLVAADLPYALELKPVMQLDAKRYYGIIYNQTGNSDNTATVSAGAVIDSQQNMLK